MPARGIITGQRVSAEKRRLALELRRRMTVEERILWRYLRGRRLHGLRFRRQQVIDGFVVDSFCSAAGLVVELDSGVHKAQAEYDARRDHVLRERGLRVLRVSNEDVRLHLGAVLERIAALAEDGGSPGQ